MQNAHKKSYCAPSGQILQYIRKHNEGVVLLDFLVTADGERNKRWWKNYFKYKRQRKTLINFEATKSTQQLLRHSAC